MKKLLGLILGLFIVAPVMGAGVSEINKDAYLHHIKSMNCMRKQIIQLMNKENKTAEEQALYEELSAKFTAKQSSFDDYLTAIANDDAEGIAKEENKFNTGKCPKVKCEKKCEKPCYPKAKCEKKCKKHSSKAKCEKKCEKPCCPKAKCEKPCKKPCCPKAKCEKPCEKQCPKAKCEKKCEKQV